MKNCAFNVNSKGESQWKGSPRKHVLIERGGKQTRVRVKDATVRELARATAAGEVETADVVFGWLPQLACDSMKKQMANVSDAKEMTELTFLHGCPTPM